MHRDRGVKLDRYRHFGVPEYWIVDIDARTVDVLRSSEGWLATVVREGERLSWTPVAGGPTLDVAVLDILP
ncbi:hypothetical protein D3C83_124720 [compost metagenome]